MTRLLMERKKCHLLVTTMWSVTSSPCIVIHTHLDTHLIAVISRVCCSWWIRFGHRDRLNGLWR